MPDLAEPGPNVREPETSFADRTDIPARGSRPAFVPVRVCIDGGGVAAFGPIPTARSQAGRPWLDDGRRRGYGSFTESVWRCYESACLLHISGADWSKYQSAGS